MMRPARPAFALAALGALAASSIALAAEEKLGPEGVFTMIVVKDGKKFNRCIMHQGQGKNVLRIASSRDGQYSLSVPTAGQDKSVSFSVSVDNKSGYGIPITGQDKERTWSTLPKETAAAIRSGRSTLDVELGAARFKWRLNKDMDMSFAVLDSCVEGYRNGA